MSNIINKVKKNQWKQREMRAALIAALTRDGYFLDEETLVSAAKAEWRASSLPCKTRGRRILKGKDGKYRLAPKGRRVPSQK